MQESNLPLLESPTSTRPFSLHSILPEPIVGGFVKKGAEGRVKQKRKRLRPAVINGSPEGKEGLCESSWLTQTCRANWAFTTAPREGEDFDFASAFIRGYGVSASEKKRRVSETLDPQSRVQKSVTNGGRVQLLAAALTPVQGLQFVAPQSDNFSLPTINIDSVSESDFESEINEFFTLPSPSSLKRTFELLGLLQVSCHIEDTLKEDQPSQNSMLMMKARGLLNLVGPYLEEMEIDCPGAGAGFLAIISEGVSRAIRGETIFMRFSKDDDNMPNLSVNKNNSWATRAARGHISAANNSKRRSLTKLTIPRDRATKIGGS
ncbi:hypothetical protein EV44_g5523 [Erysiphe necator]|uniref:Uncharacterized protein n=1 Tax=Uncinula necator TaxID=52586 RepID=A0A0B1PFP8_UNCNE|nr:hypothetical protein EV44_g5523 [Erysiphe necator]